MQSAAEDVRRLLDNIRLQAVKLPEPHRSSIDDATTLIETITAAHMIDMYDMRWRDMGMSAMEANFASFLHSRLGKVVTKRQIWDSQYAADEDGGADRKIIDVYICKLRKHFRDSPFAIETVWGTGYRMVERSKSAEPMSPRVTRALGEVSA